jgi:hypothetical protein
MGIIHSNISGFLPVNVLPLGLFVHHHRIGIHGVKIFRDVVNFPHTGKIGIPEFLRIFFQFMFNKPFHVMKPVLQYPVHVFIGFVLQDYCTDYKRDQSNQQVEKQSFG